MESPKLLPFPLFHFILTELIQYHSPLLGCMDGDVGVYMQDESIEQIVVRSGSMNGTGVGDPLEPGRQATIIASVFAYFDGSQDYADFFYTSDAYNVNWTYIGTMQPSYHGYQDLMMEYTIPVGPVQAVRVNYRHQGSVGSCSSGGFDDRDDLVYAVLTRRELEPCLTEETFQIVMEGSCSYDLLHNAVTQKLSELELSCPNSDATSEIVSYLDVENELDARSMVTEMCKYAVLMALTKSGPFVFDRFSGMDHDFNKAFFDGQSSWNDGGLTLKQARNPPIDYDGGASAEWRGNSKAIVDIFERHADRRQMTWPDSYQNFEGCQLNAAMCCWVDYDATLDAEYHNNTEICYVDHERAPSSNHINAGFSLYGDIHGHEEAFCHGFAWESGSLDDIFKGNHLFLSEIYENMHNKGLTNNIPGKVT
jgi:hypothetical protein